MVRFWCSDGSQWVGNFQGLQDWSTKIVLWPEADSIAVIAMDNFYLVDASNPENYVIQESPGLVDDAILDDERDLLFVLEPLRIHAYGRNRRLLWTRLDLGGYVARLEKCSEGGLTAEIEAESGESKTLIRLSAKDGATL